MDNQTDQQLLADYAEHQVEAAFTELVRRHVDLVYSAALRMVRDSQMAEDVTQSTFIALARNATQLNGRSVLSGWLHGTARNIAANSIRSDVRRRAREQEAAVMNELPSATPEASWEDIAPHVDAALGELSESDRDALLLRYFEKKSAQEMALVLGVTAEAAQKRVTRAVERMREILGRHGKTVGAGGLIALLSAHAVQAAPAGLALSISAAATLVPTLASTAAATTTQAIAMTTIQKTLVAATVVVLAGTGIYETRQASRLRDQVNTFTQQQAQLAEQIQQLEGARDQAANQLAALRAEKERAPDNNAELLRLRGMAGVARRATAEAEQLRAQLAQQAGASATNPITGAMADAMKQGLEQEVEGQLARMTASLHLTPQQAQAAREILMRQAQAMSVGMQQALTGKFDKKELNKFSKQAGNTDDQIKALLTPEQQAAFPAYQHEEAAFNAGRSASSDLMQMQSTLGLAADQMDGVYAALYDVSLNQLTNRPTQNFPSEGDAMQWALDQKTKALEPLLTPSQLENYRAQQARKAQLIKDMLKKLESSGEAK